MRPKIKQLPPVYGWAASAVFAGIGAYFNVGAYIAITSVAALVAYAVAVTYHFRAKQMHRSLERVRTHDIRALAAGRRAEHVRLVVIGRDGSLFTGSVRELIEMHPDHFVLSFDSPYHVRVYYHPAAVPEEHRAIAP